MNFRLKQYGGVLVSTGASDVRVAIRSAPGLRQQPGKKIKRRRK